MEKSRRWVDQHAWHLPELLTVHTAIIGALILGVLFLL